MEETRTNLEELCWSVDSGVVWDAAPVIRKKEGWDTQLWLQCWTASGVKFLQAPSHIKTIKLRNLFKAANDDDRFPDL